MPGSSFPTFWFDSPEFTGWVLSEKDLKVLLACVPDAYNCQQRIPYGGARRFGMRGVLDGELNLGQWLEQQAGDPETTLEFPVEGE